MHHVCAHVCRALPCMCLHIHISERASPLSLPLSLYMGVHSFMTSEIEKTIGCQNLSEEPIYTHRLLWDSH